MSLLNIRQACQNVARRSARYVRHVSVGRQGEFLRIDHHTRSGPYYDSMTTYIPKDTISHWDVRYNTIRISTNTQPSECITINAITHKKTVNTSKVMACVMSHDAHDV